MIRRELKFQTRLILSGTVSLLAALPAGPAMAQVKAAVRANLVEAANSTNKALKGIFNDELTATDIYVQLAISGTEYVVVKKYVVPYTSQLAYGGFVPQNPVTDVSETVKAARVTTGMAALETSEITAKLSESIVRAGQLEDELNASKAQLFDNLKKMLEQESFDDTILALQKNLKDDPNTLKGYINIFAAGDEGAYISSSDRSRNAVLAKISGADVVRGKATALKSVSAERQRLSGAHQNMASAIQRGELIVDKTGKLVPAMETLPKTYFILSKLGGYARKLTYYATKALAVYPYISIGSRLYIMDVLSKDPGYVPVYEVTVGQLKREQLNAVLDKVTKHIESEGKQ